MVDVLFNYLSKKTVGVKLTYEEFKEKEGDAQDMMQ